MSRQRALGSWGHVVMILGMACFAEMERIFAEVARIVAGESHIVAAE